MKPIDQKIVDVATQCQVTKEELTAIIEVLETSIKDTRRPHEKLSKNGIRGGFAGKQLRKQLSNHTMR